MTLCQINYCVILLISMSVNQHVYQSVWHSISISFNQYSIQSICHSINWCVIKANSLLINQHVYQTITISELFVGLGGTLVESTPFVQRPWVRLPLYPPRRDPGQVLNSQLPVALRREIPAQYPCCVGSASE